MESLLVAVLLIAGFVGAVFIFGTADEELKSKTGRSIGDWFWGIIWFLVMMGIGIGGIFIIINGVQNDNVGLNVLGIIVSVVGFGVSFSLLRMK
jgi:hypothetical protein